MPFVEASGARIYYETQGDGPPLLMHPGFGCNRSIYRANIPALAAHFRTIVLDPRGAGRSDAPANGYTMEVYANDCAALLDALGVERAHVLGTSFGGMVAQNFALLHPGRLRKLVLGCTTPGGAAHALPPQEAIDAYVDAASVDDPAEGVRMRARLNYTDSYLADHLGEIEQWAVDDDALRSPPQGIAGQLDAVAGHDVFDRLPQVSAPTLVAHGDDDGIVPVANGRNIAAQIPGAQLKIYEGARHVFFYERADEFNRDVLAFLGE